ncbi:hypothetical protein mvi_34410 [Methylobacterium indicum]|uniref:Uncharacterized protein n=1 Tax=Methylobacterium indicum TaxID=1775910 RepID=A0A8H9C840_9HYPH|nr:hypothetical protein mvi_34410 [Methylobacterium indicum]
MPKEPAPVPKEPAPKGGTWPAVCEEVIPGLRSVCVVLMPQDVAPACLFNKEAPHQAARPGASPRRRSSARSRVSSRLAKQNLTMLRTGR